MLSISELGVAGAAPAQPDLVVSDLVSFALHNLPALRLDTGLYCFDQPFGGEPRGESVRYSMMVLLGYYRAAAAGYRPMEDLDELWQHVLKHQADFSPGDYGLALWVDSRRDGAETPALLTAVDKAVPDDGALAPLVGMEIGWLLIGLANAAERDGSAERLLARVFDHLCRERRAESGMYHHDAASRWRRRLPNFATEVYTLLALATIGRIGFADRAVFDAERLANHLLRLQLPDGAWPWLFDAERAQVVERYEIYSVHQDAMAPMALLELTDLTGDTRYAAAAARGLAWSRGHNELGIDLLDVDAGFAHRSIRRRAPWHRAALGANSAMSLAVGRPTILRSARAELNRTQRPYHLGWMLEAWAGREHQAAQR